MNKSTYSCPFLNVTNSLINGKNPPHQFPARYQIYPKQKMLIHLRSKGSTRFLSGSTCWLLLLFCLSEMNRSWKCWRDESGAHPRAIFIHVLGWEFLLRVRGVDIQQWCTVVLRITPASGSRCICELDIHICRTKKEQSHQTLNKSKRPIQILIVNINYQIKNSHIIGGNLPFPKQHVFGILENHGVQALQHRCADNFTQLGFLAPEN